MQSPDQRGAGPVSRAAVELVLVPQGCAQRGASRLPASSQSLPFPLCFCDLVWLLLDASWLDSFSNQQPEVVRASLRCRAAGGKGRGAELPLHPPSPAQDEPALTASVNSASPGAPRVGAEPGAAGASAASRAGQLRPAPSAAARPVVGFCSFWGAELHVGQWLGPGRQIYHCRWFWLVLKTH